jgi:hypothetical protein
MGDEDEIEQIARGLTKAQRRALAWYIGGGGYGGHGGSVVLRNMERKGLAHPTGEWDDAPLCVTVTERGYAVAKALEITQ